MYNETTCVPTMMREEVVARPNKCSTVQSQMEEMTKCLIEMREVVQGIMSFTFAENPNKRDCIEVISLETNIIHNRYLAEEILENLKMIGERLGV